jgi:hypothetical protein
MRREGTVHFYRLTGEALQRLSRELFTPEQVVSLAGQADSDAWERKVAADVPGGRTADQDPPTRARSAT